MKTTLIDDEVPPLETSRVALTAAHCGDVSTLVFYDVNGAQHAYTVQADLIPSDYAGGWGAHDLRLVCLDEPVELAGVNPAPLGVATVGTDFRHVGFSEDTGSLERVTFECIVSAVSVEVIIAESALDPMGQPQGIICPGDSGGPLFYQDTVLVGILTAAIHCSANPGTPHFYVHLAGNADFIDSALANCAAASCPILDLEFTTQYVALGDSFDFSVQAAAGISDPTLQFEPISTLPAGSVWDPVAQTFAWTPTNTTEIYISFDISNGVYERRSELLHLVVDTEDNAPPSIATIPDYIVGQGQTLEIQVNAMDPEGLPLEYGIHAGPFDAVIDPQGVYQWVADAVGTVASTTISVNDTSPLQLTSFEMFSATVVPAGEVSFLRADVNGTGAVDIADAISALSYLFLGGTASCVAAFDSNSDDATEIVDAIFTLDYLFGGGLLPAAAFPACTDDAGSLGCAAVAMDACNP